MNNVKYVISKEFARVFKDKKLVVSLFILPAVLVIGIYSLVGVIVKNIAADIDEHVSTVYIQNAPDDIKDVIKLTGYDKTADITYLNDSAVGIDNIKDDILNGNADLYVVFDKDFHDSVATYKVGDRLPDVEVNYNSTKDYSSNAFSLFKSYVLENYKQAVVANRIGGADMLTVFNQKVNLIVNEDEANGQMLAMLVPYIITILVFASAMSIVIDAIAGEKERGTMARLLMTPAKRSELAFGKITALTLLSMISAFIYAISVVIAMPMMGSSFGEAAGVEMSVHFSALQIIELMVCLIVLAYLYVALISALAIRAKDVKTASSLVSPLYIIIMVAAMTTMFTGSKEPADVVHLIPIYGTAISVQKIMTNSLTFVQFLYSVGSNLIFAAGLTFSVSKAFDSEKVMFNA